MEVSTAFYPPRPENILASPRRLAWEVRFLGLRRSAGMMIGLRYNVLRDVGGRSGNIHGKASK
jgi:hypothetical protein